MTVPTSWSGQAGESTAQGTLGLLLDINEGSLAVYKGGQKVGVAVLKGRLKAPLRWTVSAMTCNCGVGRGDCIGKADGSGKGVRIEAKAPPPR